MCKCWILHFKTRLSPSYLARPVVTEGYSDVQCVIIWNACIQGSSVLIQHLPEVDNSVCLLCHRMLLCVSSTCLFRPGDSCFTLAFSCSMIWVGTQADPAQTLDCVLAPPTVTLKDLFFKKNVCTLASLSCKLWPQLCRTASRCRHCCCSSSYRKAAASKWVTDLTREMLLF